MWQGDDGLPTLSVNRPSHHASGGSSSRPPASCRLSFYLYNTPQEVDRAVDALQAIVAPRPKAVPLWRRLVPSAG